MWLSTYKNYRVLCWGRLHMWTKFGDDWWKIATCITENVTISFKHEYRRETLTSRCDVIGDIIIMKIILVDNLHTIFLFLLSNSGYVENWEIFKKFQNWRKFEVGANFFVISVTESKVCYLDSQSNFLHFELLIDAVAKKKRSYDTFKIWPTFWPRDLVIWPTFLSNELAGIMDWCLLVTKFGDDWLSRSWDFVKFPYKQTDRQTRPTNILAKM